MTPILYAMSVETCMNLLGSLSAILDKAGQYAEAKKFDPGVLVNARLAPDMFDLAKQVQIASDHAKGVAARLAGREPPSFEDNEKTLDELKTRVAKTIDYLKSVPADAFEGAEDRKIEMEMRNGMTISGNGLQFLRDWALPNIYFHVVTAYDILRHNGVEIGKRDYMGFAGSLLRQKPAT
jgi:uncharacterized protein